MGLTGSEAIKKAEEYSFRAEIKDSVHVEKSKPGTIVDQVPEPGLKVKQNRTIYLTINAISPELVKVPKLTDVSYRQALVLIENAGLKAGNISYEQSEFKDLVIKARFDGSEIFAGEKIPRGSLVDLVLGNGAGAQVMDEDSSNVSYF
jgi:eukaryotic-like serine/threonine-protein kinase